ncbi:hypothetical protein BFR78_008295 [Acinetobacter pittii]|nr:hypothetical protein [Acinetobacter pittii]MCK0877358.1 hypothetical protein [Acinetobacter pittii]
MALGPDAIDGTVVNVNGTNYTVTAADLANGFITATVIGLVQWQQPLFVRGWC